MDGTRGARQIDIECTRFIARIDGSSSALITCVHPVGRDTYRLLAQATKDLSLSVGPTTFVGCNPDEEVILRTANFALEGKIIFTIIPTRTAILVLWVI